MHADSYNPSVEAIVQWELLFEPICTFADKTVNLNLYDICK